MNYWTAMESICVLYINDLTQLSTAYMVTRFLVNITALLSNNESSEILIFFSYWKNPIYIETERALRFTQ